MADNRELLAAQATGGINGLNAYREAQAEVEQRRRLAVNAAMQAAAGRGAPVAAQQEAAALVAQPAAALGIQLGGLAGSFDAQMQRRGARSNLYAGDVAAARGLIGDQAAAAAGLIDAETRSKIALSQAQFAMDERRAAARAAKEAAAVKAPKASKSELQATIFSEAAARLAQKEREARTALGQVSNTRVTSSLAGKGPIVGTAEPGAVRGFQALGSQQAGMDTAAINYMGRALAEDLRSGRITRDQYDSQMQALRGLTAKRDAGIAGRARLVESAAKAEPDINKWNAAENTRIAQTRAPIRAAMEQARYDPGIWQDTAAAIAGELLQTGAYTVTEAEVLDALGLGATPSPYRQLDDYLRAQSGELYGRRGDEARAKAAEDAERDRNKAEEEMAADIAQMNEQAITDYWEDQTAGTALEGTNLKAIAREIGRTDRGAMQAIFGDFDSVEQAYVEFLESGDDYATWAADSDWSPLTKSIVKAMV